LARQARLRAQATILAVTGSAGKTTTKEALGYLLGKQGSIWITPQSYNNHWGVPISLAGLPAHAPFAVFELGMNTVGEIEALSHLVRPHIALITTVLPAHIGRLGSLETIADAKAEIFKGLCPHGIALLNADDSMFERVKHHAQGHQILTFGKNAQAHYRLLDVESLENNHLRIQAAIKGKAVNYILPFTGQHWPMMSLAWLAALDVLGADIDQAMYDLKTFELLSGRGQVIEMAMHKSKVILIDESYNANPDSVKLALERLNAYNDPCIRRRIAVLGDMGELGFKEIEAHQEIAEYITGTNIDLVHGSGIVIQHLYNALPSQMKGYSCEESQDLAQFLEHHVQPGDIYMVKGSRGGGVEPRMKCLVDAIKKAASTA